MAVNSSPSCGPTPRRRSAEQSSTSDATTGLDHASDALFRALSRRPARERVAVVLVYFDGKTCAQAAAQMAISIDEVARLLAHALSALGRDLALETDLG